MPVIPLEQAEAGMTLAADLLDRRGRVLVPEGAELSQRTMDALESWGVEQLTIEGGAESALELEPIEIEAAKAELANHFAKTDTSHPFVAAILDGAARALLRQRAESPLPVNTDGSQP